VEGGHALPERHGVHKQGGEDDEEPVREAEALGGRRAARFPGHGERRLPGVLLQRRRQDVERLAETYAATKSWKLKGKAAGTKTVSARFRDEASNVSPVVKDTIAYKP